MRKRFDLRSSRKGKGLLPPNPTRWEHEHNGMDLRDQLSLRLDECLDHESAFGVLREVLAVVPHTALGTSDAITNHFSGPRARRWSGMCIPLPKGDHLVVYNAHHPATRIRATLMEEFFHLWLEHPPTTLRAFSDGSGSRTFNSEIEGEAYGSGAAALVPYKSLREMLGGGMSTADIARHFEVSEQMIEFRVRVSKLGRLTQQSR